MYNIAVIVPVHKPILNPLEIKSLMQCKKILKDYHVFLLYPEQMHPSNFTDIFPNIKLLPVSEEWLSSKENYNKMKCSLLFYKLFEKYDFLLTYELDSYIFSDQWGEANCFDYDYIGAPWFEGFVDTDHISRVGNSGFSMRNIKKCIIILQKKESHTQLWMFIVKYRLYKVFQLSIFFCISDKSWNLRCKNYYFQRFYSDDNINEDIFWSDVVPKLFSFKIATISDGIKFSFEKNPKTLFTINNFKLPIGCHAWEKYDPNFWTEFI